MLGNIGQEGNDIMIDLRLDFIDALDAEGSARLDPLQIDIRNDP